MTLKDLAEAVAARERWDVSAGPAGSYALSVQLETGRRQTIRLSRFDHDGAEMVRFTTEVGPAEKLDATRCRSALELNGRFPTGSLAIAGESLVMTDTRPLQSTTAESSARAIRFLAGQADTYERFIYHTDSH